MNPLLIKLDDLIFENSVSRWLVAMSVAVAALMLTVLARRLIRRSYQRMAQTEQIELMEIPLQIAGNTKLAFLIVISLFIGMLTLTVPAPVHRVAEKILLIAICWQAGIWATAAALAWLASGRHGAATSESSRAGTMGVVSIIIRIAIWSVVMLLTLDNLGINITTLVAGLGIGGIAVALAVQNVLGDLLASLSIALDKPFEVGDLLLLDEFQGKVEQIGIKSTRLRSVTGEQIILANADLLKSRLRNFGRMSERRMVFSVGVAYETPLDKLEQVPGLLRSIIEAQPITRFDRCQLLRFGDSSIDFETTYYVLSSRMADSLDMQHSINMAVLKAFAAAGISFAYPTRRVLMAQPVETGA